MVAMKFPERLAYLMQRTKHPDLVIHSPSSAWFQLNVCNVATKMREETATIAR
jgi:hypothetical protein